MTQHIEDLLPPVLRTAFPGVRVVTETPANLADELPLIQVVGIGGSGNIYDFENPRVDLDVFAGDRGDARHLAQQIHDWLLRELPGQTLGIGSAVLSVTEFMAPVWTPYDNTTVRRFTLSVGMRLHDRSAA